MPGSRALQAAIHHTLMKFLIELPADGYQKGQNQQIPCLSYLLEIQQVACKAYPARCLPSNFLHRLRPHPRPGKTNILHYQLHPPLPQENLQVHFPGSPGGHPARSSPSRPRWQRTTVGILLHLFKHSAAIQIHPSEGLTTRICRQRGPVLAV